MTKEEALRRVKGYLTDYIPADNYEEVEEIVEALEQEPKIEWKPFNKNSYPKPEDEYKYFLTIDDKGEITIQEFLLSLDEGQPQPYFTGMRKIKAWSPLPLPPYNSENEEHGMTREDATCKGCINAKECIMYDPNMKRCREYKADPKEIYNKGFADGQKALAEHLKLCKEELLDKIRNELKGKYRIVLKDTPKDDWSIKWNECIDEVLEVIDKYRESEDKE